MWSRSRVSDNVNPQQDKPVLVDGGSLMEGPIRLDWMNAETVCYRMYFPEPYVGSYAYPLVLYIHDETRSDADLDRWFPRVSDQNFLAAAVRAPFPHQRGYPSSYSWHKEPLRLAGKLVREALESITTLWKVHPDRIYLMGEGLGADLAMELALQHGTFAGAIALNPGRIPEANSTSMSRLQKRLLLLGEHPTAEVTGLETSPGVELTQLFHNPTQPTSTPARQINHWLMSAIPGTVW